MAVRLLAVAYAATAATRELRFGAWSGPVVGEVPALTERVADWVRGPEPVGAETASSLGGGAAAVLPGLADCDYGAWTGRTLDEVGAEDPRVLRLWLRDPWISPHHGESLADLMWRVGQSVEGRPWPDGRSVVVAAPMVARALAAYALDAPPEVMLRLDIGPLGRVEISRSAAGEPWRLQALTR